MPPTPRVSLDRTHAALDLEPLANEIAAARRALEERSGPGAEMTGWLDLPERVAPDLDEILAAAKALREREAIVVVGIGGSYLGARAVIDALGAPGAGGPDVLFAGHHLDADAHAALLERLAGVDYAVNVISKSGTTTEPAIAFRLLWHDLRMRHGADAVRERVVVTTGPAGGALRALADEQHLRSFCVPDDVGGRFSVLSPVGLLPIAAAGVDIRELLAGARDELAALRGDGAAGLDSNPALAYAAARNAAYRSGARVEVLATTAPRLAMLAEWWKQLFGESEGKRGRGLFPAAITLTTDLHSLGQWMQDGERCALETALDVRAGAELAVPPMERDRDGLGHVTGMRLHEVNRAALAATLEAHADGGLACLRLEVPDLGARTIGALIAFFEYACGVSAYTLGVNPFDQPGVEAYKRNMHRRLGKPGA